uniref:Dihydrolipoamide acetyltransferase component of pyruvate dehydrogenase complex n=1 Tax=Candidatus Kentrum sp. SD TaxID=2126332 RepID=A0A450Y640_9GAMM|nr:MAG: pyruvate dehydrogenase E2 component (dihydrolipoamide acetyltransferase) [Candidatus Kentron sp. SD]VFK42008.1 MAG: pyruvate dehydrogenase E2 component (dihydrolipoamide acetyltransferase) [Candidatus Kentron sp. SD]
MGTITEVKIPKIGDFRDVEIIEVLIAPGIRIQTNDPIITLESDKATLELPSPCAGVVGKVALAVGDKVSEGDLIMTLEEGKVLVSDIDPSFGEATSGSSFPSFATLPNASPSVRRLAREFGVDLGGIAGTGPKGRILREDVGQAGKVSTNTVDTGVGISRAQVSRLPPFKAQAMDFSEFGAVRTQPLTRIQKLSGAHLSRTWTEIPQVTQHDLADITDLEEFRRALQGDADARGARVTLLSLLMKVSVAALKEFPIFNASLAPDGEHLILKQYYHVGVAVDTPEGLVVPVIRDVDRKGIFELAAELAIVSDKARGKKLGPKELQGGCFTLSSLGAMGGTGFTPILNAPEVAILGVARSTMQPVYIDGEFQPRRMLPLSLSYDHRVIDGAKGARFMHFLCSHLADIRRLLL